ncbi:MAG TPA: hypothetical protein PLX02_01555 [Syntrophorhabdaceae bacterium]|nr:hypothetical protein [Syntrophorhabdaceae bacterium]HQM80284.1 hypothetical protein [Syntrophorhabdaceae bacterium]
MRYERNEKESRPKGLKAKVFRAEEHPGRLCRRSWQIEVGAVRNVAKGGKAYPRRRCRQAPL